MVSGGAGVLVPWRSLFIDVSLRVSSIRTTDQATNVVRLGVGVQRRF
jgi:hypothetical protein